MSLQDDILDVRRLRLEGDFNDQVKYLLENVRLRRCEVEELSVLYTDLERSLKSVWPGCQIYPFGSIVTGLGIKTSDVDCYVSLPSWDHTPHNQIVMKAKHILARYYDIFSELFAIPMAKVPIVKFFHIPTGRHGDVNFKSPAGVQNSRLLGYLLHMDDRALPLAILIKYWSKIHNLTGTNLIPNYTLTLLVVFYLQQLNILPPVYILQRSEQPHIIDNWNTAFQDMDYTTNNTDCLYELLGGFFEYYRDFNYTEYIISPYTGCRIGKNLFKNQENTPEEYELYKENLRKKICQPLKVDSCMCVQDPFDHSRNCASPVHPKLATRLFLHLQTAAAMFNDDMANCYLWQIFTTIPVGVKPQKIPANSNMGRVTKTKHNTMIMKDVIRRAMTMKGYRGRVKRRR